MSRDVKISYLKSLQGYLWQTGYDSGALVCPLFPDVEPCLRKWHSQGIKLIIYSSGSVAAQKLLFKHTNSKEEKDLTGLLSGYFDTVNAGLKQEKESYEKILSSEEGSGTEAKKWLFLSDNVKEVEAAVEAGMKSFVVVREGNALVSEEDRGRFTCVESFEGIEIEKAS
jgi:enolase-phosphatase E1